MNLGFVLSTLTQLKTANTEHAANENNSYVTWCDFLNYW